MPEIPDLNIYRDNILKQLKGAKVEKAKVLWPQKSNVSEDELEKALKGKKLEDIERQGKMLHFHFSGNKTLAFHLMLNGKLYITEKPGEVKNPILQLIFDDGRFLQLADRQGWANAVLGPETGKKAPDVMDKDFTWEYFNEQCSSHPRMKIKNLITEQKYMRGIGNAYSDEILWEAGVSPFSLAGAIPEDARKRIYKAIPKVLKEAEKIIRKNHGDTVNEIIRDHLKVHNPKAGKTPTGHKIQFKQEGGMSRTYYSDEQELYN